jgi:hypothetical protein
MPKVNVPRLRRRNVNLFLEVVTLLVRRTKPRIVMSEIALKNKTVSIPKKLGSIEINPNSVLVAPFEFSPEGLKVKRPWFNMLKP